MNEENGSYEWRLRERKAHVAKVLTALEASIEGRAHTGEDGFEIANTLGHRKLSHIPLRELVKMRQQYLAEYHNLERLQATGKVRKTTKILVKF